MVTIHFCLDLRFGMMPVQERLHPIVSCCAWADRPASLADEYCWAVMPHVTVFLWGEHLVLRYPNDRGDEVKRSLSVLGCALKFSVHYQSHVISQSRNMPGKAGEAETLYLYLPSLLSLSKSNFGTCSTNPFFHGDRWRSPWA